MQTLYYELDLYTGDNAIDMIYVQEINFSGNSLRLFIANYCSTQKCSEDARTSDEILKSGNMVKNFKAFEIGGRLLKMSNQKNTSKGSQLLLKQSKIRRYWKRH
jgi:hypothetical protein